jgi:hypothetical protein
MIHSHSMTGRRFMSAQRRRELLALLIAACGLAFPASALAGARATRFVQKFNVSPDTLCGSTGTSYWLFDLTGVPTGNASFVNAGSIVQTFIADNGRGVKISYAEGVFTSGATVVYPDGSSSFTATEAGLNVKTQALGGALLEQSTGYLTITYYFDANDNFIDATIDSTAGPENNTTAAADCSVIGPYLAGS